MTYNVFGGTLSLTQSINRINILPTLACLIGSRQCMQDYVKGYWHAL